MKVTYTKLEGSASRYGKWPTYEVLVNGTYIATVQNQVSAPYNNWCIIKAVAETFNPASYSSRTKCVAAHLSTVEA